MTIPSKKKKVYDLLSPKIGDKRKMRRDVAKSQRDNPPVPPTVDNYRKNKPVMARSLNIQPVIPERRKTSPTEGMPAVNGKSGARLVEKAVTKVRSKVKLPDLSNAVIPMTGGKNDSKQKRPKTSSN